MSRDSALSSSSFTPPMSRTTPTSPMLDSWQQAETRRIENWRRKQRNDIRRQLLAHDTTHFGRKRRARRARGQVAGVEG